MTQLFEAGADDVLYIVDLSGYVFRAYHAITPLTSASGEPTQAVLGTVNMLEKLVRERNPAMLAVAMDSRRSIRKDLYPEYKSHRPPQPDDLKTQMARCNELIEAFAIPCFQRDGLEADDLIAAAVAQARAHDVRVVIVSADKDLMQLVGDDVIMWDTMRDRVFGPAEVEERFGVPLPKVKDLLALCGDTSDNIPGVPHVGPKTARDLLIAYGTLEGIYEHAHEIPRKALRETLLQHRDQAFLSRELVTLRADSPVVFDLQALRYGGRDVETVKRIYRELGFFKQLAALETSEAADRTATATAVAQTPAAAAAPMKTINEAILRLEALDVVLEEARGTCCLAINIDLSSDEVMRAAVIGISLCPSPGRAYYVPIEHRYVGAPAQLPLGAVIKRLSPLLIDAFVTIVAHDSKRVEVALLRRGVRIAGPRFDTSLAAYLLDPQSPHRLEDLAHTELGVDLTSYDVVTKKVRGRQLAFEEISVEEALQYAAPRVDATLRLHERLSGRLADEGLTKVFDDIEMPLTAVLSEMELRGVLVDVPTLRALGQKVDVELQALERKAQEVAGRSFNVHSPRQLEALLFDELKLRPLKRTKTSRSTDAATLEALADQHALPAVVLEIRQLAKLKGTYIDALPALVHPETKRIHTRWAQDVAATGRISSHDPNLQNIPIRTELGRAIRAAFVAPPDHELLSADYSQIELRVLAHLSEDPVLVEAFQRGQDIHTRTAMEIFSVADSDVTPEMRHRCKAVNFGVIYGQGDSGLAKSLGIPRTEAAAFIAAYFHRYQRVHQFMEETLARARAAESVRSLFGRRRMLPDIRSNNRARRLAAERVAMNMPIQGTAADLLKLAMLSLHKPVTPGTRMVLTVHDELVFEVPKNEAEEAARLVRRAMENVYPLKVPLVVEVGHARSWNDAH